MSYLPRGFEKTLTTRKVPRVGKKTASFISARETAKRYGVLPREVTALIGVADRWALEEAKWKNARYLRAEPDGWEIPAATKKEPLLATFVRRFEWNVFGNMQLWEHFAGLVCIAVHQSSGRFLAAMFEDDDGCSPVFYMDHETARIEGCVATSVARFLQIQMGEGDAEAREQRLVLSPEHWDRREGDSNDTYLARTLPLRQWPPFLAGRADWIVSAIVFGPADAKSLLETPEAGCFDAKSELPDLGVNEPLALYWLMRSFLLGERDVFDEAARRAEAHPAPLVRSCIETLKTRWQEPNPESALVKARAGLARMKLLPKKAAWPKGYDKKML